MFDDMNDVNRFGIMFMYTDKRDRKNKIIFLSLKSWVHDQIAKTTEELDALFRGEEEFRFFMKMSQLFEHIQSLSTDERTKDLKFYFTHQSCRVRIRLRLSCLYFPFLLLTIKIFPCSV